MLINKNNITIGNDSEGVVVDTLIVWKKVKDIYGDSTYLLTYSYSREYIFPDSYIVDKIFNDTLTLSDNAYDGDARGYTKPS